MEKPDACTLPTAEVPLRVAEFSDLFASARSVSREPSTLTLVFAPSAAPRVRDLVARESECCSFFSFSFADDVLSIGVPVAQVAVLDGLERLARGR